MGKLKPTLTFIQKYNFENETVVELPYFKIYCKATVLKAVWHWHKQRYTDQPSSRESRNGSTY